MKRHESCIYRHRRTGWIRVERPNVACSTQWLETQGAKEVIQTAEPTDLPVGVFIRKALKQGTDEGRLGDSRPPALVRRGSPRPPRSRVNPSTGEGRCGDHRPIPTQFESGLSKSLAVGLKPSPH